MRLWPASQSPAPAQLVERIARGDRQALDLVYRAEAAPVYRFALAMCGNAAWSADATHDAFVHLAEQPRGYDSAKGPLRAWLCGIARHRLLARWRDPVLEEHADAAQDLHEASPESQIVRAEDHAALWDALRELPWHFREAVVLVDLQERPYAEAAQIAGVELNTLRTRVHRGRQRLARALAPHLGEITSD
jgi:RNA polymerase sigma-70 factor (ECF subfamily)